MFVFINVDLVCKHFRAKHFFFGEVMIILWLIIGYQPYICPKKVILVQKVSLLESENFDLLNFLKTIVSYLVSTYTSKITYKCYSHTIL